MPQCQRRRTRSAGRRRPVEPRPAADGEPIEDKTGRRADQFRRHARNFLDCVKSRETPVSDLESGHRVATACHLANLSLRLGRKLRWDAKTETIPGDAEAAKRWSRPYRAPWDTELKALGVG